MATLSDCWLSHRHGTDQFGIVATVGRRPLNRTLCGRRPDTVAPVYRVGVAEVAASDGCCAECAAAAKKLGQAVAS